MNASPTIWHSAELPSLEVYLLGLVDFDACLILQEQLAQEISSRSDGRGAVLICEHPPLITVGREGSRSHIRCSAADLAARQIDVRWLTRGGGCFVHVPGQLAVYPILPIDRRGWGIAQLREHLELAVIDTCEELRVDARRRDDAAGIWSRGGMVAHIGVAVRSWVSSQGLFINVNPRMEFLRLVSADAGRVTSLAAERRIPITMHSVRESVIRRLAARLDYDRFHLYTGHPLLKRTRRVVAYA